MKPLRSRGIRNKLTIIVMISTCAALLLACLGIIISDIFSYREVMLKDLATRAQIIGNNSTAALTFGDAKPVEEMLAALSADTHLMAACVYTADNSIFASYQRPDSTQPLPANPSSATTDFSANHLDLFTVIIFEGKKIGTVFLQSDLEGLRSRLKRNALIIALVMLASMGVAFGLSSWLQRSISVPLVNLATVAVQIARDKNFSVRAVKESEDELGNLVDGFNEMLSQIQARDAALQEAHDALEGRVQERTRALVEANEKLNLEIDQRKSSQKEVETIQQRLIETSRRAGMAEVATGVLHNVGNVLNSVNVSATVLQDRVRKSKVSSLFKTAILLQEHAGKLADFFSHDPKGKLLPDFIQKLAAHLATEQQETLKELFLLAKNIEHIKDIVAMQQSYARVSGVVELLPPSQLVEDALRMNEAGLIKEEVQVALEFEDVPPVAIQKHKVLQILVNLIRNARQALEHGPSAEKQMTLKIALADDGRVLISVKDNGVGIDGANLTRIFGHGFTTKKDGHGFGLHTGALAAKEMGGSLKVESGGVGKGAEFTLELPASPKPAASSQPGKLAA